MTTLTSDQARRVRQAVQNTRTPPRNRDAEAYSTQRQMVLLRQLYGAPPKSRKVDG